MSNPHMPVVSSLVRSRVGAEAAGRGKVPPPLKVALAAGGLFLLVVTAIGIALISVRELRADLGSLSERRVAYADEIDAAALYAKAMANDERGFLISGDEQFLRQLNDGALKTRTELALAARDAVGGAQHLAVAEASADFERWFDAVRELTTIYRAGDSEAAIKESLGSTRSLRKRFEASVARAQAFADLEVGAATAEVASQASRSLRILFGYLVGASVVAFALTAWLVAFVLRQRGS